MLDGNLILVAAVFALAGFVKGAIGLGLPTIAMGLLAIGMPPVEAAAILILPSLLTNVWQMLAGPSLRSIAKRLWPMMGGVCLCYFLDRLRGAEARPISIVQKQRPSLLQARATPLQPGNAMFAACGGDARQAAIASRSVLTPAMTFSALAPRGTRRSKKPS